MPPRSNDPPVDPGVDHHLAATALQKLGLTELRTFDPGRAYTIKHPSHVKLALQNWMEKEGKRPDWFDWRFHDQIIFGFWPESGRPPSE